MSKLKTAAKSNGFMKNFMNSVGAIFIGLILILVSVYGLAKNELSSVKAIRGYNEAGKTLIQIESQMKPENNGKLVAARGGFTFSPVSDSDYPEVINDSFVLARKVEIAQWRENKTTKDGETTVTYNLVWSSAPIPSANFQQERRNEWPPTNNSRLANKDSYSQDALMGDFNLRPAHLRSLPASNKVSLSNPIPDYTISDNFYTTAPNASAAPTEMGQIRIAFYNSNVRQASVLARQEGPNFDVYKTKNDTSINRIFAGMLSGVEMVQRLHTENKVKTWIFRILLCVLICIGFTMLFSPIHLLVKYIPFLGKWLGKATQAVARVVGCILGILLSLIVITVSWIFVRPLVVIPLIIVMVALIFFMIKKSKEAQESVPTNSGSPAFATNTGQAASGQTKFCPNCGAALSSNTTFCTECGAKQ